MTESEIERKINEIEKRSPIKMDEFFNVTKLFLENLRPNDLDQVEAVVGCYNYGRMGYQLYCVNKNGDLLLDTAFSNGLRKIKLNPLKNNYLSIIITTGIGGLVGTTTPTDNIQGSAIGATIGLVGGLLGYIRDVKLKNRYEKYLRENMIPI